MTHPISSKTRNRFLINGFMFFLFLGVAASSLYFLYVPGGYQGGRNARFNMRIIFERETWDEIHFWSSVILSAIVFLHILLHLKWIKNVFFKRIGRWKKSMRVRSWLRTLNLVDDGLSAIFFLICLFSGLVLFFIPGGRGSAWIEFLSITRQTWKGIHTWSGVGMLIGVLVHLIIHWKWITKVSRKFFSLPIRPLVKQKLKDAFEE